MTLLSTKFRKEHRVHKTITKSLAQSLSTQGFSTTTLLTFGLMILRCGGCTVQCRIFSSTPGLYTLHANSTPSLTTVVIIKVVFRYCQMSPGEAKLPCWEPWLISNSPFPEPLWNTSHCKSQHLAMTGNVNRGKPSPRWCLLNSCLQSISCLSPIFAFLSSADISGGHVVLSAKGSYGIWSEEGLWNHYLTEA